MWLGAGHASAAVAAMRCMWRAFASRAARGGARPRLGWEADIGDELF
jgi:hypothetical protein